MSSEKLAKQVCLRQSPGPLTPLQSGFTLVELSIVLVIIGLMVGAILVGRALIQAAEIRATVSQLQKYSTAVNTFRLKFGGNMPGDMLGITASQYGFTAGSACMTGAQGFGDGNGLIEADDQNHIGQPWIDLSYFGGEVILFWSNLSTSNLIDGSVGGNSSTTPISATCTVPFNLDSSNMFKWIPPAKIGHGGYVFIFSPTTGTVGPVTNAENYFQISGGSIGVTSQYSLTNALSPYESYSIDTKIDDGHPSSRTVRAAGAGVSVDLPAATGASGAAGNCTVSTATATYDVGTNNGNILNCSLIVRLN